VTQESRTIDTPPSFKSFDFSDLLDVVLLAWRPVLFGSAIGALLAFGASFLLTPMYRSSVVVEYIGDPTKQGSTQTGVPSIGGFAALAGISIGSETGHKEAALATVKSRDFARTFIKENKLLPLLEADKWDSVAGNWREEPSIWNATAKFQRSIVQILEDPKTGLIGVTVDWKDPQVAADWATTIVRLANQELKRKSLDETNRSLAHLKTELEKTQNTELQRVIASLTERQIEALMYADIRDEFAFRTIDSAVPPPVDEFVSPNRVLFAVLGFFLGAAISVVVVFARTISIARRLERT